MNKILFLLLTSITISAQIARPTHNPFNNGMMMPNQGYYNNNFAFPNNTNHPLNFHRPNNFSFQNNWQRPQQQYFPQQNNWQRPQIQPYRPSVPQQPNITPQPQNPQPQNPQQPQTNNVPLFTRKFHLNNGYLYGRPTLWYDTKTNKMQPWIRKNLR